MSQPEILMESGVASRDLEPFVVLRWGDMEGQLTPDECREHARRLFETAEAADSDAAFARLMTEKTGLEIEVVWPMLRDLRVYRGTRRPEKADEA